MVDSELNGLGWNLPGVTVTGENPIKKGQGCLAEILKKLLKGTKILFCGCGCYCVIFSGKALYSAIHTKFLEVSRDPLDTGWISPSPGRVGRKVIKKRVILEGKGLNLLILVNFV